ncbi:LytR/AlgR family response regulator transcription factor [Vibrio algarum]|uniref:LytTR family DNA-binding domain-containing protein n=1 Tax=Vibrio algarum TaxID=3020714 RepID=A0ABT4YR64_9VIBR|nr:LytTR family DNA-binding domain-containing protein [Vibrio sp. KJ40-1]MDB1124047.1 LytTR family DNA-binding domain-containing protein [Vibrio sp. KJ40-1]
MKSTNVTAVIADDEPLLRFHLNQALADLWPDLDIKGLAENGQKALDLIELHHPDILFLDIKMPVLDGMAVANKLAQYQNSPYIVFVTAYDEFAVQAFEANAIDYLLKPLSDARLERCIRKIKARVEQQEASAPLELTTLMSQIQALTANKQPNYLTWIKASKGEEIHLISISEVLYFKAEDKYVSLYKSEQGKRIEYLLRTSLKELMSQLDPDMFWQIHRSTVVNVSAIEKVKKDFKGKMIVMIGTTKLPVSRAMQSLFTNLW